MHLRGFIFKRIHVRELEMFKHNSCLLIVYTIPKRAYHRRVIYKIIPKIRLNDDYYYFLTRRLNDDID